MIVLYTSVHCTVDDQQLQTTLNKLFDWSTTWQLPISVKKCAVMAVGKNMQQLVTPLFTLGHNYIPAVESMSDLGVVMNRSLSFTAHVCNVVRRASTRMNLLFKCFMTRNNKTLIRGYKVYVRPILEYCSVVWSPYRVKDIKAIEAVQRKFTKRLNGLQHMSYAERLQSTQLESLQERRTKADLIFTYKVLFGHVRVNSSDFFSLNESAYNTRGHAFKLNVPPARIDVRKYFFSCRVVPIWNNLPDYVDFSSLVPFKHSVRSLHFSDNFDFSIVTLFLGAC